jgi:hypothetical protein
MPVAFCCHDGIGTPNDIGAGPAENTARPDQVI